MTTCQHCSSGTGMTDGVFSQHWHCFVITPKIILLIIQIGNTSFGLRHWNCLRSDLSNPFHLYIFLLFKTVETITSLQSPPWKLTLPTSQILLSKERRVASCTLEKSKWNYDVMTSTGCSKHKNEKYKTMLTEDAGVLYLGRNGICMYINIYYMKITQMINKLQKRLPKSPHLLALHIILWPVTYDCCNSDFQNIVWKRFHLISSCLSMHFKAKKKGNLVWWLQVISMTESLQLWKQKPLWELLTLAKSSGNLILCGLGSGVWVAFFKLRIPVAPCR